MNYRTFVIYLSLTLILIIGAISYFPLSAARRGHNDALQDYSKGSVNFMLPASSDQTTMIKEIELLNNKRREAKLPTYNYKGVMGSSFVFWANTYWNSYNKTMIEEIRKKSP